MIEFKIRGTAIKGLGRISANVMPASILAMKATAEWVRGYVVKYKLSGQVLHNRNGGLSGAIQSDAKIRAGSVIGRVGSGLKGRMLAYARIHELGGIIRAKDAPYLIFKTASGWVKTKEVKMPKRSYLQSSVREKKREIVNRYGKLFYASLSRGSIL